MDIRENTRKLAAEFLRKGDATGWFDALYLEAAGDNEHIPWADLEPNQFLRRWAEESGLKGENRTALVVGCGLGDDAKFLDELGFRVTAFDISPAAVSWAKKIHADTRMNFYTVDLFNPPRGWIRAFDFVLEVYTIQALPPNLREQATDAIASFVKAGGQLAVVTGVADDAEQTDGPPWSLTMNDLARFETRGFERTGFSEMLHPEEDDAVKRVVAIYQKRAK